VNMSYEQVARDFTQGTWSSGKQAILEDRRGWVPEQLLLTNLLVCPVYELWFAHEVAHGKLPISVPAFSLDPKRYSEAEYVPDAHDSVEPEKDLQAAKLALELRMTTRRTEVAKRGGRFLKILDDLRTEEQQAAARGIVLPEVAATKPPPVPVPQPGPKPPAQMASLDCGTGAGGFQAGNKCGGEGGGGSDIGSKIGRFADKVADLPEKIYTAAKSKVQQTYGKLEKRYGKKFAVAIMAAGLVGFPIPVPGASLLTAAPVIAAAEIYRATSSSLSAEPEFPNLTDEEIERLGKEFIAELLADWKPE